MNSISDTDQLLKSLALTVANRPRATMRELARHVGISKATLHRYCGTRENLLFQLEAHAEVMLKLIIFNTGLTYLEPLKALRRLIQEHLAHRELLAFLMAQYRPDFLDLERDGRRWQFYLKALDGFFLRGQQKGLFRIDITAAIFTELFLTLVYGVVDAEQRGRAASADSARTVEKMFLHGALSSEESHESHLRKK